MLLRIRGHQKDYDLDFTFGQKDIEPEPEITAVYDELRLKGWLEIIQEDKFELAFTLTGQVTYPCSKCLTPVTVDVEYELDEVFDLDGQTIGLDEYINDCLFINEPSQILCKPDCKGLCPYCGADLNVTECDCQDEFEEEETIDPRLAKLRELL